MPKFVIERQYLVPMYQHIAVEAESLEEACKKGISDDVDWDTQEMDSDNARQTTITNVKGIADALELVTGDIILRRDRPAIPDLECQATAPARSFTRTKLRPGRSSTSPKSSPTRNKSVAPPWQHLRRLVALEPSSVATCRDPSETQTRCPAWPFAGVLRPGRSASARPSMALRPSR
jgi:hypothetical protein